MPSLVSQIIPPCPNCTLIVVTRKKGYHSCKEKPSPPWARLGLSWTGGRRLAREWGKWEVPRVPLPRQLCWYNEMFLFSAERTRRVRVAAARVQHGWRFHPDADSPTEAYAAHIPTTVSSRPRRPSCTSQPVPARYIMSSVHIVNSSALPHHANRTVRIWGILQRVMDDSALVRTPDEGTVEVGLSPVSQLPSFPPDCLVEIVAKVNAAGDAAKELQSYRLPAEQSLSTSTCLLVFLPSFLPPSLSVPVHLHRLTTSPRGATRRTCTYTYVCICG